MLEQTENFNSPLIRTELLLGRILGEVSNKLSSGHNFNEILDFLFNSLDLIIPYDRIGIALLEKENEDHPQICSKWLRSKLPMTYLDENYCAPIRGSSLEKILKTGNPRIINDLVQYGREHPQSNSTKLIIKEGIRSSLTCPLKSEGRHIGIVFFSSTRPGTYKDEHVQTYLQIADELSIIIEQSRLRNWFHQDLSRVRNIRMLLHDLKNPLNVIQAFLEISKRKEWYQHLNDDAKKVFDTLKRNSDFMQELLEELSELHKLGADARSIEPREILLNTFIPGLALRAREQAKKKENSITVITSPLLPEKAYFDVIQIHRVIDNLISNASKFSKRGSNITISVQSEDERIIIGVSDEGPGIPDSERHKLFSEFGRTSVIATEGEKSTGLGLAISKKIIEQHGGEISVESQVGKGSTFSFWIPVKPLRS
ncbi:MAG: GAF domain-containing sensor histidine kinase [Bacteriovoracaceae bacterium]